MEGMQTAGEGPRILDPAPIAIALTSGPDHVLIYVNPEARRLFGDRPRGLPIRTAFADFGPAAIFTVMDHVYATKSAERISAAPLMYTPPSGTTPTRRYFTYSCSPASLPGREPGLMVAGLDVTEQITAAQRVNQLAEEHHRALRRYQSLVLATAQAVWVSDADGSLVEPSEQWAELTGQSVKQAGDEGGRNGEGWAEAIHPDDRQGFWETWLRALSQPPEVVEHTYRLRLASGAYRHYRDRAVPIREDGTVVEWVGTSTDIEREWQQQRRDDLLSRAAATADHTRLEDMLTALTKVIVPELTDGCGIYLLPEAADRSPHAPPTAKYATAITREGLPNLPDMWMVEPAAGDVLERVVREHRTVHHTFPPGQPPDSLTPPELAPWLRDSCANSVLLLPVVVDGVVAAVAGAVNCAGREPITAADVRLLADLLEHARGPLNNALNLRRTQRVALELQRGLLTDPPEVPGALIASRYRPSPSSDEVGGDWYDAFVLPDGALALTIGDVVGHDLTAANAMGQLRSMLRAIAYQGGESPAKVLTGLDSAATGLGVTTLATVVHARLSRDPDGWRVTWSNAGHLPPLLLHPDGTHEQLMGRSSEPVLCVAPGLERTDHVARVPTGSTLLLYTDGLVETPQGHLDHNISRLARQAARATHLSVEDLCDHLLTWAPDNHDDVALLAFHATG
ncbi:SpoIIE family protein phosphatase [Allostreptomyces psammosilenae]|uniref:PAS domain S-box-containing protein n=1 Tax=Allostreptomyces psammosilenae TaxID=1892865 RepID=A0A852ZM99_9ACTN|nr:SpoIIE family protein phosphatase [Allostreptomyces psammosilenae]NYI03546.1 PAS domain S-box-containing protein [Allostreptomyces psammosilenae]